MNPAPLRAETPASAAPAASEPAARRIRPWHEHAGALLFYTLLSIALSWPLYHHFRTRIIGSPAATDAQLCLWVLWSFKQWVMGAQPLFYSPCVYYPHGISLFLAGIGPFSGIFALPFWWMGPTAAYNGASLVGLTLTGYYMYLLVRGLGFRHGVALFAGVVLQVSPIHLSALLGHLDKVFIGLQPLMLLTAYRALDRDRSAWKWALATGVVLLLLLFHNAYQFVFGSTGAGIVMLAAILLARPDLRPRLVARAALVVALSGVIIAPLLLATISAAHNPEIENLAKVNAASAAYSPDLLQFFLPSFHHRSFPLVRSFAERMVGQVSLNAAAPWNGITLENAVTLPITCLLLCGFALTPRNRDRRLWIWGSLLLACVVLALGPSLRLCGKTRFTDFGLPIILPYAFLDSLPGISFMRCPGRWMELGAVGLGVLSSFGLAALLQRFPRFNVAITATAIALLLAESWPFHWPTTELRPVPGFYQRLAADHETYGVLDLPGGWPTMDAVYQTFQITHRKGIAWGYLAHSYTRHPLSALAAIADPDLQCNGRAGSANPAAALYAAGYRYVVRHKTLFDDPSLQRLAPPAAATQAATMISRILPPDPKPIEEDSLVRVYRLDPPATSAADDWIDAVFGKNWSWREVSEPHFRWATSPATLTVTSGKRQPAQLKILPFCCMADGKGGFGSHGHLRITCNHSSPVSVPLDIGEEATIPLMLRKGANEIELTLEEGNFLPRISVNPRDPRTLSFAISKINICK